MAFSKRGWRSRPASVAGAYFGVINLIDKAAIGITEESDAVVIVECGRHVQSVETASLPSAVPEVVCHGVAIRWMD